MSIPTRCRARVFKTRCRAVGKHSGVLAVTRTPISGFGRQGSVRLSYENLILESQFLLILKPRMSLRAQRSNPEPAPRILDCFVGFAYSQRRIPIMLLR